MELANEPNMGATALRLFEAALAPFVSFLYDHL